MSGRRVVLTGLTVGLALGLAASCGKEPTSPDLITKSDPITTQIVLDGPASVAPHEAAQFTLIAHLSDGTTRDVTSEAVWSGTVSHIVTVSAGVITGLANGESIITARYTPPRQTVLTQSREVIVLPTGTFRVTGRVIETELGVPVLAAKVAVTGGSARGLSATTDVDGRYRLYGVAGDTEMVATMPRYQANVRRVIVTGHQTVDFELSGQPIVAVEGSYTLTITAASSCRNQLPEELRVRSYPAEVRRDGRLLLVTLNGAIFVNDANEFPGWLHPDGVAVFALGGSYYGTNNYSFGVLYERIGANRLSIYGHAYVQPAGERLFGTLIGGLELQTDGGVAIATCPANNHDFLLSRR